MKRFQSGDVYKPARQGQGFEPIRVPDITPLLRENNKVRMQEAEQFANARIADLQMEEQSLKYQALLEEETVQSLAQFSTTLSEAVVDAAEKRNEAEEQRGLMLAYTNGVDLNSSLEFDAQERALEESTGEIYGTANQFYQEGMPVDMVNEVKNLSGWAKYGYMRGLAEQGGSGYGNFYMQAARELRVNVPGREEPINLLEANTAAERAYIKNIIAGQYMSQFRGMNPLLLNKYLFPKMKEWERADDLEFAKNQQEAYEEKLELDFKNDLASLTDLAPDQIGIEFEKRLNLHAKGFNSMAEAKEFAFKELGILADNLVLTPAMVEQLKGTQILNRATNKLEFMGDVFKPFFTRANLETRYNRAFANKHTIDQRAKDADLQQQWEELKRRENPDGPHSEALEEAFKQKLLDVNQGGLGYLPKWFDQNSSKYDRDVEAERQDAINKFNAGIPITNTDLLRMHPENKQFFSTSQTYKPVDDSTILAVDSDQMKFVRTQATLAANKRYATDALSARDPAYGHFKRRFEQDFQRQYYQRVAAGDPKAFDTALGIVERKASLNAYDKPLDTNETRASQSNYTAAYNALSGSNYTTTKLPGLGPAVKQLEKWVKTGEGTLPAIFHSLAHDTPGVSGWDIARYQYRLYTNSDLARDIPSRDRAIAREAPAVRDLMNRYPSRGRNGRAYVLSSGDSFNNPNYLIAGSAQTEQLGYITNKFRRAIISQESGGDYTVLGQYVPGQGRAVGIGQVMPANIGPWTEKYYGKRLNSEEYRNNPAAQDAVLNGEFNRMLKRELANGATLEVAVRRAAAEWYGGTDGLANWNNPEFKGAFAGHPNMAEYTMSIWTKFQGN